MVNHLEHLLSLVNAFNKLTVPQIIKNRTNVLIRIENMILLLYNIFIKLHGSTKILRQQWYNINMFIKRGNC